MSRCRKTTDLPALKQRTVDPKGVLQKNMKMFVFLGASLLVIVAAIFSAGGKKTGAKAASRNDPPQPTVLDNTDNNVADLKTQLAAEQQKQQDALAVTAAGDPALANATAAQKAAASSYTPAGLPVGCVPGQPCPQMQAGYPQQSGVQQLSPLQQEAQQLVAKERERADSARFASNIAYARPADAPLAQAATSNMLYVAPYGVTAAGSNMIAPRVAGEMPAQPPASPKRAPEVNIDAAVGQPYVIYEGTTLDGVLMNRLDGDAVGPVKVLVSNPLYSHDHQHVLIPDGTIVLGEAKKIGATGFGQQRRMAVTFHRLIMPDGYSVDLDQFHGLDQIGEERRER